jgi:DNA-binding MarR family transcriptional regulator
MKHVAMQSLSGNEEFGEGFDSQDTSPPEPVVSLLRELLPAPRRIGSASPDSPDGNKCTVDSIRGIMRARLERKSYFPAHLFADPAWDMLLDLYAADLAQVRVTITSLCAASNVPMTTALRWIASLEREGLVRRHNDPLDARRYFMSLTDASRRGFEGYFSGFPGGLAAL